MLIFMKLHKLKTFIFSNFQTLKIKILFQIDGAARKPHHLGKWEKVHDYCITSLSSLEDIATKRRRNFILDQVSFVKIEQSLKLCFKSVMTSTKYFCSKEDLKPFQSFENVFKSFFLRRLHLVLVR